MKVIISRIDDKPIYIFDNYAIKDGKKLKNLEDHIKIKNKA